MTETAEAIAAYVKADGYDIIVPPEGTAGYTFEARSASASVAVQVKEFKAKVNIAQVQKFEEFLELPTAKRFDTGWLISINGFFKPALTHVQTEESDKLRLGTFSKGKLVWEYPNDPMSTNGDKREDEGNKVVPKKSRYFGVFTCKGGVGKTTVAAHLAGAFALMGFNVILLDLDPDRNLRKLFLRDIEDEEGDASLFVPGKKGQPGATITVLNPDQWDEKHYPDVKIVICDCSPVLEENSAELVRRFDYCIVPTTLNPLGVAKKSDVIVRTFEHIRELNKTAEMFALINGYDATADAAARNKLLLDFLERELSKYTARDSKCKFIHPDHARIRHSLALYYWGIHIVRRTDPELAFREVGGRSAPRTDFLQLAEYLEHHTDIDALKKERAEPEPVLATSRG